LKKNATIIIMCVLCAAFHIVVCGLDSILARRWINGMLVTFSQSLLSYSKLTLGSKQAHHVMHWPVLAVSG